ncbi:hypothetical protein [Hymenobacter daeguensis]
MPTSLHFSFCAETGVFFVRWLSNTQLPTLQHEYEAILAAEPAHRTDRWLLDVRQRPTPDIEAANWVAYNWLPRAANLWAPGRLCVAYLISPQRAEALVTDPGLQESLHDAMAPNRLYTMALFSEEEAAIRWLKA